jgi:hypothetical protein
MLFVWDVIVTSQVCFSCHRASSKVEFSNSLVLGNSVFRARQTMMQMKRKRSSIK